MRLEISQFGGMAPLVDPTALGDQFAELAKNVRFDKGVLAPSSFTLSNTALYPDADMSGTGARSVVKLFENGTRFSFSSAEGSEAFVSPVAPADTWGRVYFFGNTGARFTANELYINGGVNHDPVSYRLGVPAPTLAPTLTRVDGDTPLDDAGADRVSVAYAYAYVDKYGHEGPLSPATDQIDLMYGQVLRVKLTFSGSLPEDVNFEEGVYRVYRAAFDGSTSGWQFLFDAPVANGKSAIDNVPVGEEGETAISESWYPPPDDMQGLCLVASSFAAGYFDHYVCFSELKLPHAWPKELQYPVKYRPVKIVPLGNALVVLTTGRPYIATGADPYSAIPQELPINAPCLAPESVVDMGGYVVYASHEGLAAVGEGIGEVLSASYFDRGMFLELVDEHCTAFGYNGEYVFSTVDDQWMSFSPKSGFAYVDFGFAPSEFASVTFSVRDNQHYFTFSDGRVRVVDYASSADGAEWLSKRWKTPPQGFSYVMAEADAYPVTVEIITEYLSYGTQTTGEFLVTGSQEQRVPSIQGNVWQVRVKPPSDGVVYRVILAQSGRELISG